MDEGLQRLIQEYLAAVREAVAELSASGIPLPASRMEWVTSGAPKQGVLVSGRVYLKHGYGCAVGTEPNEVDFDFGERGETNGFDGRRLARFSGFQSSAYGFADEKELERALGVEAEQGRVVKRGSLYYLTCHVA
ncbi:DUF6896 domain-containing protein [Lysobacter korlensis]|uniref:DUF6896 domain-containing protein n=1 Tax=Lysobacter korlensis TaxID=553636 RepID=A0ABV6S0V2_9GAMM